MARLSKADQLAKLHAEALQEFDRIQAAVRDERMQCLEDRRFYSIAGAQWEGPLGEQFDNRPRLEFNKVHLAVIRIFSEYRNNRITVDFTPKDGASRADMADVCDGLYRADEQDSNAQEAYDNAFEEGVGGGFGAFRLRACYEDEDDDENDKQRVAIEPIFDADSSVFFDLDAKRQDKADATRCFVLAAMTPQAFEAEFGHAPSSWPKEVLKTEFDWATPDLVYVAEYYRVEESTEVVRVWRGLDGEEMSIPQHEFDEDEAKEDDLIATGFREVRQKRVKTRKVRKLILSGLQVEEDCGHIAGKHIPIIPFYAKRWYVDNVERCMGHVRLAKDAQRLENSLLSWLTEMAGRFDVEKPIFTPEQIAGHATMWAEDNVKRYPFLLTNLLRDSDGQPIAGSNAPVAYTKAPNVPPAMAALVQIATQALQDLLGNQQAGEELQPNISGKAVELIQNRLDMQTFIYMSNFSKSMKRAGEVWLSMKKEITVEEGRRMKMVTPDGSVDTVVLNRPKLDPETHDTVMENDLSDAAFDVVADVGPSSSSRRAATVRALTNMASITTDEQDRMVLIASAMANIDGEGLQDVRDYYRAKLVRMGVVKPTEEEKAEMLAEQQGQQPDPQSQALLAMAEESQANAAQARAKTVELVASAGLKQAQTEKTMAEAAGEANGQVLASVEQMRQMLAPQEPAQPLPPHSVDIAPGLPGLT